MTKKNKNKPKKKKKKNNQETNCPRKKLAVKQTDDADWQRRDSMSTCEEEKIVGDPLQ